MSPTPNIREYYIIKHKPTNTFMADANWGFSFNEFVDLKQAWIGPRKFTSYERALRCLREHVRGPKSLDPKKVVAKPSSLAGINHVSRRGYGPCVYGTPRNPADYEISTCRIEVK